MRSSPLPTGMCTFKVSAISLTSTMSEPYRTLARREHRVEQLRRACFRPSLMLTLAMTLTTSLIAASSGAAANPLLVPWAGPDGGWPAFDKVKVTDFRPALEAAMDENLKEIDVIAADKSAPTFDNTIVALEKTGRTFARVRAVYGVWTSAMLSDDMKPVQDEMEPKLAAFQDKIYQN